MGLLVLESHGWDPDSRQGLGAEGARHPLPREGEAQGRHARPGAGRAQGPALEKKEKPKLLDAKKVRKMVSDDRRRTEQLRQQLFGNVDVEKYLGGG